MKYKAVLQCAACGAVISETDNTTAKEIAKNYVALLLTSVFAGSCPEGCRPTFNNCNARTKITYQNEKGERVEFKKITAQAFEEVRGRQ